MSSPFGFYSKPAPFHGTTVVEIAVPSGKLIAADDLRSTPFFDVEPPQSLNYGAGLDAWTKANAERAQIAQAFVGNTCPSITKRTDGTLLVVSLAWNEDADPDDDENNRICENGETIVASICTDLWSKMLTDYDHWLAHGGPTVVAANSPYALEKFWLIDVEPGRYRWTVYTADDSFDLDAAGRREYAKLERIGAL